MTSAISTTRRTFLIAGGLLPLAACGGGGNTVPQVDLSRPMTFDYLTPLRLTVGSVDVVDSWQAPNAAPNVDHLASTTPAAALQRMARDRLLPGTTDGTATFTIQDASIIAQRSGSDGVFSSASVNYKGTMTVRIDVRSGDGTRSGFATAQVTRSQMQNPAPTGDEQRRVIDVMVRQMMNDMNVELEYQVRRSLRDWLQVDADPSAPPSPEPVQQESLTPQT